MATSHQAPPTLVLRAGSVAMTATEVRRPARISGKALSSSARPATLHEGARDAAYRDRTRVALALIVALFLMTFFAGR